MKSYKPDGISNLAHLIGLESIRRNLKAEDCAAAADTNTYLEAMGSKQQCPPGDDSEMMVAGDVTINHQRAALPGWLKWILATVLAFLALLLAVLLAVLLLYFVVSLPPEETPQPPQQPSVRFIQPQ